MKSIKVQSLPIDEVIKDIANLFQTNYSEYCGEYAVEIPETFGNGTIKGFNFSRGLGIVFYDCEFLEDFEFQFVVDNVHPVKFLFCTSGAVDHRFENSNKLNRISKFQNAIVANKGRKGHVLKFKANTRACLNSVEIIRSEFKERLDCDFKNLDKNILKLFRDQEGSNSFYYEGFYSLVIANLFKEIDAFSQERFLWNLYMEGKSYLILVQQIMQYKDDLQEGKNRTILRQSDIELIEKSAKYIYKNLEELGTIHEIATTVGVSAGKLQSGFKELFGVTVNDYIINSRLKVAAILLAETDYSLSEIQDKIGLSSKSYFSKIFKEFYGISPSMFRQENKKKILEKRQK
ncbi:MULTISPECIES: helix-turn-helix domain-containing protein [Galbibacter]|uniref:AraC family transcriptional regulator n=1 Tax=Galbibacter pacificus TaxID=2996052 RepID=A0ABT6FPN5_9FLAO|nr:AraC family transcriptional regulator [Galbibacter pacificus]MDG3582294.1 AraC family transcriptional regulator [Galbibacter pacificus]MDG3585230.1 AraC family transcriptional regulator [Galbibacter pacificus]